jgi:hypothetical protein
MFPQLDPTEATYLAGLIVSIFGILLFSGLAFWMIRRKQKTNTTETIPTPFTEANYPDSSSVTLAEFCPLTPTEQLERCSALEQAYLSWKAKRLLQVEDGHNLFVRAGVEKSGLRYQLVASSQVQAFAILLSILMAENDPQASTQAEALFASLLAHPAYEQSELSSWKYLPDLPRSPKLDPDPHAEAWVILAILMATRRWQAINRFHYSESIHERLQALQKYTETLEPEQTGRLPFAGYLVKKLIQLEPGLDWSALSESQELFSIKIEEHNFFGNEPDTSRLGLSLLQLGLLALVDRDPDALRAIRSAQTELIELVEGYSKNSATGTELSSPAMLACAIPALLTLREKDLLDQVWNELVSMQPDKNDGLGATLKLLGMAFLANKQI